MHRDGSTHVLLQSYLNATAQISNDIDDNNWSDLDNWSTSTDSTSDIDNNEEDFEFQDTGSKLLGKILDSTDDVQFPSATFTTQGQARPGSHHGRGGRRVGSGFRVREKYLKYATAVLCSRMYVICAGSTDQTMRTMVSELKKFSGMEGEIEALTKQFKDKLKSRLAELSGAVVPYTVERLPFSVLGVSARFTKSDAVLLGAGRMANSRERHIVNTWVDTEGLIRCTCIGSTQFSIFSYTDGFKTSCCDHAEAFITIFNRIGESVFNIPEMTGKVFYNSFSALQPDLMESLRNHIPFYTHIHRDRTVVFVCDAGGNGETTWVPIRCVERKGIKFLCAFCDLLNTNSCNHIRRFSELLVESGEQATPVPESLDEREYEQAPSSNRPPKYPISFLPVAPVSCPFAMKRDVEVCEVLKANRAFVVPAPLRCIYCQSPRLEDTKDANTSGVIMCTMGACRMEIHTYKCSGCKRQFSAEGRQEGLFLESICTGATQVLLRNELIGFAVGNGTMSSRLNQLHSRLSALEDSDVFPSPSPSKSTKTIYNMCISFARLMLISPPQSLFCCSTCQGIHSGVASVPRTVCVDGIWAGYLKKSSRAFRNVSVSCKGKSSSKRARKNAIGTTRTTLIRLQKTVCFLLQAVKGEKIEVTASSLNALAAAIRIVNDTIIPSDFHATSVCGVGPTDYHDDIGDGCLVKLRRLTHALFDERTLLYRMLNPLHQFYEIKSKRRRKQSEKSSSAKVKDILCHEVTQDDVSKEGGMGDRSRKRKTYDKSLESQEICAQAISQAFQLGPVGVDTEDRVIWNRRIWIAAEKDDRGREVYNLYKSLVQGPVTHLICRRDIPSVAEVVKCCKETTPDDFLKVMVTKERFQVGVDGDVSNIAETLRILTGGLVSAAVIDKISRTTDMKHNGLLMSFSHVISEAVRVVKEFYAFCDEEKKKGKSTAAEYARNWSSSNPDILRAKFRELSMSPSFQDTAGVDYDDMYTTGTFFPTFPQVRPLPFNDEGKSNTEELLFGFCTKHYLQKNGSFTPGSVTFCCSCPHPIIIGFKVLEWDEGPKAILDVLLSRFPDLSRFIIYDFACGVYKTAVLPLWWAVEKSTLVSDPLHGCNHKCSPAFLPSAHSELDMQNTISHEQRNSPIAHIKNSLQQTSQEVYITLLAYHTIINNIKAKTRTTKHTQEPVQNRSEHDIEWGYFHRLKLKCLCCEARLDGTLESGSIDADATNPQNVNVPEGNQKALPPEELKEEQEAFE